MRTIRPGCRLIAPALLVLAACTSAAQAGPWFWGAPLHWYTGAFPSRVNDQRPPYYALHPPVYYSYPVARTYGEFPISYMPAYRGPHWVRDGGAPLVVINRHVKQAKAQGEAVEAAPEAAADPSPLTVRPQVIINPFVEPQVDVASRK